jgi:PAS domain S-box-containing protein
LEKIEMCLPCEPFNRNMDLASLEETLKAVNEQFTEFRRMIGNVSKEIEERQRAEEALQKAHHELEIRVEERTEELTKANALLHQEVAERKRAEEALRDSEERYRTLFEDSRDAIYITAREGWFIDVNQSALDLFGYSKEEMLELDVKSIYLNPSSRQQFQQEVEEKGSVTDYGVKFLKKDGTEMDCLLTSSVRRADDGTIIGYQSFIRDITERKRLEAQLQQAQKLEAIGTLAGGIAHDFNNLLMGIQGNASLLLMDIGEDHAHHTRLKSIENQVHSGARLTSQLLGYARKGRYEVKAVDLNRLVNEISDTFGRTKKDITIRRELADNLLAIEADPGQMEQVLFNLFLNAADAMPNGGTLGLKTVNTTHREMQGRLYRPKRGDYVLLQVTDTGMGMDKTTAERIFDPFFTTKERGRGTGLGLASAYGIVKGHDGYVDVDSVEGKGTTFNVYLPASPRAASADLQHSDHVSKGNETVLLVDDEETIREVGGELLEAMGYTVLLAEDGKKALETYQENQDQIDVVLLDMVMPNMGGGEAYDRLKEIDPDVKVLLSSGFSIDGEATKILGRGCDGFIQKPFTMKDLSERIRQVVRDV